MNTIMTFSKIDYNLINLSFSSQFNSKSIMSDNLIRSNYQTIFVLLNIKITFSTLFANIIIEINQL